MIITKDMHAIIELTSMETQMLRALLQHLADKEETLVKDLQRFRTDLLFSLPQEPR